METSRDWSEWWRRFIGISDDSRRVAKILCQRYIEEMQQHNRLAQVAEKMHYPQFRDRLLQMANEYKQQAGRLASEIVRLGGTLPDVPAVQVTNENSWQQLLTALDADERSADRLIEQLRAFGSASADVTVLLQEISREQRKHRDAIKDMLMRSDPFAFSLG